MKRKIAPLAVMGAMAFLGTPAQAQADQQTLGVETVRAFLPVETRYVAVLQGQGTKGVEKLTAPGFTFRHGHEQWTGKAAFAQIYSCLDGIQGGKAAVTIRHLTLSGRTAMDLTRERITYPPIRVGNRTATAMVTMCWKRTWQRTGRGWEMTMLEAVPEKALGPAPPVEFTVFTNGGPIQITESAPNPRMTRAVQEEAVD